MKKICSIIFIAGMLSSGLFAEKKYESVGFHFSVPFGFESTVQSGVETNSIMTSIGLGFDSLTLFSDKVGFYANFDFFLPQRLSMTQRYGTQTASFAVTRSDFNSIWGASALMGPAFVVSRTEKMLFTISPGIHYTMLYASASSDIVIVSQFGLGANFQDNIFFSSRGFFMFGADVAYDFFVINSSGNSGRANYWAIKPNIGIGFNF